MAAACSRGRTGGSPYTMTATKIRLAQAALDGMRGLSDHHTLPCSSLDPLNLLPPNQGFRTTKHSKH